MSQRRVRRSFQLVCVLLFALAVLALPTRAAASEYHGQVTFHGWPVPGATIKLTQATTTFSTVSDQGGLFTFSDLQDEPAKIVIEMQGFSAIAAELTITPNTPAAKWEMTLLPLDQLMARTKVAPNPPPTVGSARAEKKAATPDNSTLPDMPKPQEETNEQASDGFLVNGSVNNAATSRFSLDQAFGNRKPNSKSLYNGGLAFILDNSALDARPYSLSGRQTPKASYNRITGAVTLGGPTQDSASAAARAQFFCCLPVDARPHRRN